MTIGPNWLLQLLLLILQPTSLILPGLSPPLKYKTVEELAEHVTALLMEFKFKLQTSEELEQQVNALFQEIVILLVSCIRRQKSSVFNDSIFAFMAKFPWPDVKTTKTTKEPLPLMTKPESSLISEIAG